MSVIFEATDKTGRKIRLTQEQWAHIQKHNEMPGKAEHIKHALRYPDVIIPFEYGIGVKHYYQYDKIEKRYLFISVKYLNGHGFIITSFYTDTIK